MRVLITGASGYVAKYVIEDLEGDHELVLLSRRHPSEGRFGTQTKAPFIRGDLTSMEDCRRAVEGVDAVAHIGAIGHPTPETFGNNSVSTYNLLEAAREAGIGRFIFASSNCALGHCFRTSGHPFEAEYFPFDEQHPSRIEENYGLSKKTNELTLESYTRAYGMTTVAMRLNWCWGEREYAWRREQPFDPAKHTGGFWAYVDMRDVAQAFRKALERPREELPPYGAYFISAADTMADEPSAELVARFYPQHTNLASKMSGHDTFFSWQAARGAFGYEPQHSWR
jgi:nucleoside-diphosphate-sugar epimerase